MLDLVKTRRDRFSHVTADIVKVFHVKQAINIIQAIIDKGVILFCFVYLVALHPLMLHIHSQQLRSCHDSHIIP